MNRMITSLLEPVRHTGWDTAPTKTALPEKGREVSVGQSGSRPVAPRPISNDAKWHQRTDASGSSLKSLRASASSLTARPAIKDALRACSAGSPVGSHVACKQLRCLLHGNGPAIKDALRACSAGSPAGSHVACKQLRCLLHGNVPSERADTTQTIARQTTGMMSRPRAMPDLGHPRAGRSVPRLRSALQYGTKRKSATRPCYVSSRFGVSKWDKT